MEQETVTAAGRHRRRVVKVVPAEVCCGLWSPGGEDLRVWERLLELLGVRAGETTFEVWFSPLKLRAVDQDGRLIVVAPGASRGWLVSRFGPVLTELAALVGREVVIADEVLACALDAVELPAAVSPPAGVDRPAESRAGRAGRVLGGGCRGPSSVRWWRPPRRGSHGRGGCEFDDEEDTS